MCGAVPPLSSTPAGGREPPWPAASPLLAATSPGRPLRRAESSCLRSRKSQGRVTRSRAVSSPRQHVRHQIRRLGGRTTGAWGGDAAPLPSTCSDSGPELPDLSEEPGAGAARRQEWGAAGHLRVGAAGGDRGSRGARPRRGAGASRWPCGKSGIWRAL